MEGVLPQLIRERKSRDSSPREQAAVGPDKMHQPVPSKPTQPEGEADHTRDVKLFEEARIKWLAEDFPGARRAFQSLINTYPDSRYTATAFLGIADIFFDEEGTARLQIAHSQYRDFLAFFPNHRSAERALFRSAAISHRLAVSGKDVNEVDRLARDAEARLEQLLRSNPSGELKSSAENLLSQVRALRAFPARAP